MVGNPGIRNRQEFERSMRRRLDSLFPSADAPATPDTSVGSTDKMRSVLGLKDDDGIQPDR